MNRKQLIILFICNVPIFFTGGGLFPLLPLYAAEFGASETVSGLYLASVYLTGAAGTVLTGWLAKRVSLKKLYLFPGLIGVPALFLLGQATAFWQVVVLTSIVWLCGGTALVTSSILTGLFVDSKSRGKWFSLLFLAGPIGSILAGLVLGSLAETEGFAMMFTVNSFIFGLWPLLAALFLADKRAPEADEGSEKVEDGRLSHTFLLLLAVCLLIEIAFNGSRLGISLSMKSLAFSAQEIGSTSTVSGLLAIPVVLLMAAISDRIDRKLLLSIAVALAAVAILVTTQATALWHFWVTTSLFSAASIAVGSLMPAFATDLLAVNLVSKGIARVNMMGWIAAVIGLGATGYVVEVVGAQVLFRITAVVALIALALLISIGQQDSTVSRWATFRARFRFAKVAAAA
ncbi:MAG: MFS transporter [Chloroflexota bacterium]